MSVFISDKDTAKLYVHFLDQNNPKSKYQCYQSHACILRCAWLQRNSLTQRISEKVNRNKRERLTKRNMHEQLILLSEGEAKTHQHGVGLSSAVFPGDTSLISRLFGIRYASFICYYPHAIQGHFGLTTCKHSFRIVAHRDISQILLPAVLKNNIVPLSNTSDLYCISEQSL